MVVVTPIEIFKSCFNPATKISSTSGIYVIFCAITNKFYVGSAFNLKVRKNNHFSAFRGNRHLNKKLLNAVNKYGIENFYFIPIEYCDKKDLMVREQYFINFFNAFNGGYNQSPTADVMVNGHKISEETKRKISETKKGTPAWNKGIRLGEKERAKLRGPRPQICGKNNPNYGNKISNRLRQKLIESQAIEFSLSSPDGKIYWGKNLNKFCGSMGLSYSVLHGVNSGKTKKSRNGWTRATINDKSVNSYSETI